MEGAQAFALAALPPQALLGTVSVILVSSLTILSLLAFCTLSKRYRRPPLQYESPAASAILHSTCDSPIGYEPRRFFLPIKCKRASSVTWTARVSEGPAPHVPRSKFHGIELEDFTPADLEALRSALARRIGLQPSDGSLQLQLIRGCVCITASVLAPTGAAAYPGPGPLGSATDSVSSSGESPQPVPPPPPPPPMLSLNPEDLLAMLPSALKARVQRCLVLPAALPGSLKLAAPCLSVAGRRGATVTATITLDDPDLLPASACRLELSVWSATSNAAVALPAPATLPLPVPRPGCPLTLSLPLSLPALRRPESLVVTAGFVTSEGHVAQLLGATCRVPVLPEPVVTQVRTLEDSDAEALCHDVASIMAVFATEAISPAWAAGDAEAWIELLESGMVSFCASAGLDHAVRFLRSIPTPGLALTDALHPVTLTFAHRGLEAAYLRHIAGARFGIQLFAFFVMTMIGVWGKQSRDLSSLALPLTFFNGLLCIPRLIFPRFRAWIPPALTTALPLAFYIDVAIANLFRGSLEVGCAKMTAAYPPSELLKDLTLAFFFFFLPGCPALNTTRNSIVGGGVMFSSFVIAYLVAPSCEVRRR